MSIHFSRAVASFIRPPSDNHPKLMKRINKYKLIDKGGFYEKKLSVLLDFVQISSVGKICATPAYESFIWMLLGLL